MDALFTVQLPVINTLSALALPGQEILVAASHKLTYYLTVKEKQMPCATMLTACSNCEIN